MKVREVPPVKPYFPEEDIHQIQDYVQRILRSGMLTPWQIAKGFECPMDAIGNL